MCPFCCSNDGGSQVKLEENVVTSVMLKFFGEAEGTVQKKVLAIY